MFGDTVLPTKLTIYISLKSVHHCCNENWILWFSWIYALWNALAVFICHPSANLNV